MVRFALLGCAAAGLALLATAARAEESQAGLTMQTDGAKPATARRRPALRTVGILPPARPADEVDGVPTSEAAPEFRVAAMTGAEPPLPAQFQALSPPPAPALTAEPVKVAAVSTLPPLRPAFPSDAQPAEPAAAESTTGADSGDVPPSRPDLVAEAAGARSITTVLPPERPSFPTDAEVAAAAAAPDPQPAPPAQPRSLFGALFGGSFQTAPAAPAAEEPMIRTGRDFLDARIAHHAKLNAVPAALVHRVVVRESKYNPRAVGRGGAMGLMQIKHATARGMGYDGPASGLLDAETNLTYAVKYLAGAYRLADGSFDRAVQHYARGYYYEAKRRNARLALKNRNERLQRQADAAQAIEQTGPAPARSLFTDAR